MADSSQIHSLLDDTTLSQDLTQYTDSSLQYLSDYNQGSYSGSIFFDTQVLASKWIVLSESFLSIPLRITSSTGTAYSAATLASWKASILSLISGVTVSNTQGSTVLSDQNISIINNIRLLVEKEYEWEVSEAAKLMFAKDTVTTPSSTTMGGSTAVNTSTLNSGFLRRIQLVKQQTGASDTTTWTMIACIPLSLIHDFFAKCDFPMINQRWMFTFNLNAYNNTVLSPWCCDSVAPAPVPTITIGAATSNGVTQTSCRLYYKTVKFSPEINQRLVDRLNSGGFSKKIFFRCTDTYLPGVNDVAQTSGTISKVLNSATVRPLRIWLLAPPTGGLSTAGSDTVNGSFVFPGRFTNINCQINNQNYYDNPLQSDHEIYSILEEQFPGYGNSSGSGSLISFSDFQNSYRLHCIDVSRLKDRLKDPNSAVSIQLSATRSNSTSCDYYVCVERLQACTMSFTNSEVKLFVGL